MSSYTWVVARDNVCGEKSDEIGRIGPCGATPHAPLGTVVMNGQRFRLLNESGDVCYTGYIHGEFAGPEPLDDYGRRNGCARIEYLSG